jgi:hypothetical protein
MYARVATFTNRDTNLVDELTGAVRERIGTDGRIPGASRFLLLLDNRGGKALIVTFFESDEALEAAERSLETLERDIPEPLRGRRVSRDTYEVTIDDVADGARAVRMTSVEGDPLRIGEDVHFFREHIVPEVADLTGWRGIVALADRKNGSKKTITFWDSDESLRASDVRSTQLGIRAAAAMGDAITGVDHFAVAVHESLVTA